MSSTQLEMVADRLTKKSIPIYMAPGEHVSVALGIREEVHVTWEQDHLGRRCYSITAYSWDASGGISAEVHLGTAVTPELAVALVEAVYKDATETATFYLTTQDDTENPTEIKVNGEDGAYLITVGLGRDGDLLYGIEMRPDRITVGTWADNGGWEEVAHKNL